MFTSQTSSVLRPVGAHALRKRFTVVRAEADDKAELRTGDDEVVSPEVSSQSTSQARARDVTGVKLDIPSAPVQTPVLGYTQGVYSSRLEILLSSIV
jgi:hypothetical protein